MQPRTIWRWCAVAGLVTFLCSWLFGRIPGLVACGPTGGLGPIIAFEFVRSPADVASLFGSEPCRSTLVRAQTIGLLLDGFGFIPAYTTFLILAAMASARITDRWPPLAMAIAATIALAGLCDEIEGVLLYLIVGALPGTQALTDALWWPVHVKFALLAAGSGGIGALLLLGRGPLGAVFAMIAIVGAARAAYGLIVVSTAMMTGFTIAWVTILLASLLGAWRPSAFSSAP